MATSFDSRLWSAVLILVMALATTLGTAAGEEPAKTPANGPQVAPEGTPEELLLLIKQLQQRKRESKNRAERMAKRRESAAAIVAASDKILASGASDTIVAEALVAELDALPLLARLGDKDAEAKSRALVEKYQHDPRPAVAQAIQLRDLARRFEELDRAPAQAAEAKLEELVATVMERLKQPAINDTTARLVVRTAQAVQKAGSTDLAARTNAEMARRLAKTQEAKYLDLAAQLAAAAAEPLAQAGQAKEAIALYQEFIACLHEHEQDEPGLAARARQLEGALHRLDMVGRPLAIEGKLVDGDEIDWTNYKGKVVLVDFWATWCGPCLAELPNVKQTYEKYHDQGFDVVGISLDDDRATLEQFLKKEQLAWPILFSDDPDATGWKHPLATKYGVDSIPRAILVDRQGNVVSLNARGEALGEAVARLLEEK